MPQQESIPKISDICKKAVTVTAEQPVQALLTLFQEDPDLSILPVTGTDGFLDCVSRKGLLNLMSRPFALDLYAKKQIQSLLGDLPGLSVVMAPDTDINAAAIELLSLDPALQTDAFPLVEHGSCVGIVEVSDLMLAVAGEQKRLLGELDRLSSRIREEVARGVKIQQDLLPLSQYSCIGIALAAGITTSSEIGGDFFDYFVIGADKLGLLIADVSGHGVQAGMVTTAAKASLHTLLSMGVTTPAGLLAGMNNAILATARQSLLMTCLIACIDTGSNTLTIANAGHNFPYIFRDGEAKPQLLETTVGFPLGFEREYAYPETCTSFGAGDAIFIYTDGIVECENVNGEELGYERFSELLQKSMDSSATHRLHDSLLAGAALFTGTTLLEDDVTTLFAVRSKTSKDQSRTCSGRF
jgi:serine phosphatase RsbU (regulator of sigma subunit)